MSNRTDKFAEKAKTPTMVIDGEKGIVHDSAEWHFYFWKNQYFEFLLSLIEGKTYLKLDKKVGGQYLAAYINTICKWYDGAPCKIDFTPQKFIEEYRRKNLLGRNKRKSELTG